MLMFRLWLVVCMAWRLALARPAAVVPPADVAPAPPPAAVGGEQDARIRRLLAQAAHARQCRSEALQRAEQERIVRNLSPSDVQACAAIIPGAAAMLGVAKPSMSAVTAASMMKLATSPRLRGSGPVIAPSRRLQLAATACMSSAYIHLQAEGLTDLWPQPPCHQAAGDGARRGARICVDVGRGCTEASSPQEPG
jgi:hypothetical protein